MSCASLVYDFELFRMLCSFNLYYIILGFVFKRGGGV